MVDKKLLSVIKLLARKLEGVEWVLIGSLNLALQGVSVKPRDIDILADKKSALKIDELLSGYRVKPLEYSENKKFKSYLGLYLIDEVEIEVMGELQNKSPKDLWTESRGYCEKIILDIDGMKIPAISLRQEHKAYLGMGRFEKAKLIEKVLNNNN